MNATGERTLHFTIVQEPSVGTRRCPRPRYASPTASPCWERSDTAFVLSDGFTFNPQWLWRLGEDGGSDLAVRGGHCARCSVATGPSPRRTAYIGFCRQMLRNGSSDMRCLAEGSSSPPRLEDGADWQVGALVLHGFGQKLWQHHVLDSMPILGMALPLLRALGQRATLVHSGALELRNVLASVPSRKTIYIATKYSGYVHVNFAMAFTVDARSAEAAGPSDDRVPGLPWDQIQHRGLTHPSWSYWPYRLASQAAPAAATQPTSEPYVAWLTRGEVGARGTRWLVNESSVLRRLNATLRRVGVRFDVLSRPSPSLLRGACGVVGIHGGALANIHACAPGTRVIEIIGEVQTLPNRGGSKPLYSDPYWCYAGLARGVGLDYYAYYPLRFPLELSSRFPWRQRVIVDEAHLAAFVADVFSSAPQCLRAGGSASSHPLAAVSRSAAVWDAVAQSLCTARSSSELVARNRSKAHTLR